MTTIEPAELRGIDVSCAAWTLSEGSAFDDEADRLATAELCRNGVMPGFCNLSGSLDTFIRYSGNLREDLIAARSASSARMRALTAVLGWSQCGDPSASLRATCAQLASRDASCYIAETSGVFFRALHDCTGGVLTSSEYHGSEYRPGETVRGTRHEDLQALSFPDASFDVVITSDVMEHVPHAPTAEREIVRVLRPRGWYLFTIPFYFTLEHDRVRSELRRDGAIVHAEVPEYHGGPVRGGDAALVYRDFSENDLRERFTALNCSFRIMRVWSAQLGILGTDMVVMAVQRLA